MKRLLLLRHAKSSWDNPTVDDIERPLAARGQKAARLMSRELAARDWLPDQVLVSPAARTRETWSLVAPGLPGVPQATFPTVLYMATAKRLLAEVQKAPDTAKTLLLIGHNPGLEELARRLANPNSEPVAMGRVQEKFPTAALARLVFEGNWADLDFGGARLTHCLRPKDFGGR